MQLPQAFSTEGQAEMDDFSPIAGDCPAIVHESELKLTKAAKEAKEAGDQNYAAIGQMLVLKWKILSGPHKGRVIFDNLNIVNKNPVAVEIANKALTSICKACGKVAISDSQELHGIPVTLKLAIKPADKKKQTPPQQKINAYVKMDGAGIPAQAVTNEAGNAANNANNGKSDRPWD